MVYYFHLWVGDQVDQTAKFGMESTVLAYMRLDLVDGNLYLPDEVIIRLAGRQPPYRTALQAINLND